MDSSTNLIGTSHGRSRRPMRRLPSQDFDTEIHPTYEDNHYYHRYQTALSAADQHIQPTTPQRRRDNHCYPPQAPPSSQLPSIRLITPYDSTTIPDYPMPSIDSAHVPAAREPGSPSDTLVGSPIQKQSSRTSDREKVSTWSRGGTSSPDRPSTGRDSTLNVTALESQAPTNQDPFSATAQNAAQPMAAKKGVRFWLILISLMVVIALSAIDLTIISTALPTIVKDLGESSISGTWITSAFLLTVTAFQPMMGGLADVVGRRYSLLISVLLFLGGSVICALAQSILVLVVGRGVQGVGGGGIQAIVEIILSDITTLRERGLYMGAIGLVFAIASLIAPILGGVFSNHNWRWIFWINLPIGGVACALIVPFMKLNTPPMPFKKKLQRMDLFGNLILMAAVVAILIAVTEGGVEYPWGSLRIWLPLTLGLIGMVAFFLIEFIPNPLARDPILPLRLFSNRTAATSYLLTFLHGIVFYGAVYILPIYHQAIKGQDPLNSAYDILPATAPAAPAAVVAGLIMALTGKYRVQTIGWWAMLVLGTGLLYMFDVDTTKAEWVVYELITGVSVGAIFAVQLPPIQASLPVSEIAHSTATFAFSRSFGSVWGIAIATAIFTAKVDPKLAAIQGTAEIGLTGPRALALATELQALPEALQAPVIKAYASAIRSAMLFFIPIAAAGFLASFFLKDLALPDFNDTECGIAGVERKESSTRDGSNHTPQGDSTMDLADSSQDEATLRGQRSFQSTLPPSSSYGSLRTLSSDGSPYKSKQGSFRTPQAQASVESLHHKVAPMPSLTEVMGHAGVSDGFGGYLPGQDPADAGRSDHSSRR